eukprot:gnl/MRDRNA2_/MRDRNA2_64344_c0_seq2.p1 gnl/MRDRNA2_/MRDRNA2_64344_c0~~gnl/MRDRNA2_/MRDRNA2_64344_c0_seq2.p1  ORF type:complete len:383 (-),score=98.08 gnl/MRDRNA2_/MRDRNA2_64344_c0_seq2:94-1242(-)
MFCMKVWILMFIPAAFAEEVVPLVEYQSGTLGGDGMDGPMQMPVVAGSRHYSKTQLARGTDADDDAVSVGSVLFVPIFAIVICSVAYFLIMTDRGREVGQSFGLVVSENSWSKMEVVSSQDSDHAKWVRMALEAPLVQQAITAMGMKNRSEPDGTEMNSFCGGQMEEQWKPSSPEDCRKSAEKKLHQAIQAEEKPIVAADDFDPNVSGDNKADLLEANEVDLIGGPPIECEPLTKEPPLEVIATEGESIDLLGKEDEGLKEPCFDPIQIASSTTETAPAPALEAEEEDTTAAFMANRGVGAALSPEDFLKSLSAPVPPSVQAAPIENTSTNFSMDNGDLLGAAFNVPAPACSQQPVTQTSQADSAPAFDKIATVFNFDDDEF